MKKLIFLLLLLLIATPCFAQDMARMSLGIVGGGVPAAGCSSTSSQEEIANDATSGWAKYSTSDWWATPFVWAGTTGKSLCRVDVLKSKAGSPTGTIYLYLYSHNVSNYPDSLLTNCGSLDASTLQDAVAWYSFASCNYSMTNGVTYWIVLAKSSYDSTNYPNWGVDINCTTERREESGDGITWANLSTTACYSHKIFILE